MAHNDYLRPGGTWADNDVPDGLDFTALDQRQYLSIHEGGGTWAITSNVVIGATAAQTWRFTLPITLDSLNGTVASGKTLSIASGGVFRVDSGAAMSVNTASCSWGNGAILDMLSGSILKIESGALLDILSGGVGDIESGGMLRAKSGGLIRVLNGGTLECQASSTFTLNGTTTLGAVFTVGSGGQIVVSSGRDLTVAAGATLTLNGTMTCGAASVININGDCNLKSSGNIVVESGASQTINSGGVLSCQGTITLNNGTGVLNIGALIGGSAELVVASNSKITRFGKEFRSGSAANTSKRIGASSTINATFDPSTKDIWEIPNIAAIVTYTLDDPADTTMTSEHVFTRNKHKNPVGTVILAAPGTIATFDNSGAGGGSVVVYWDGSSWAAHSASGDVTA